MSKEEITKNLEKLIVYEELSGKNKVYSLIAAFVILFVTIGANGSWFYWGLALTVILLLRALYFDIGVKVLRYKPLTMAKYFVCIDKYEEAGFWIFWTAKALPKENLKSFWKKYKICFNLNDDKFKKEIKAYKKQNLKNLARLEHFDERIASILKEICEKKDNNFGLKNKLAEQLNERKNFINKILQLKNN